MSLALPLILAALAARLARAEDQSLGPEFASGSTGRADPGALSAAFTSPGILPLERGYTLGGGFRMGPNQGKTWQAGAMDSVTGPVTLGVLWSGHWETAPTRDADKRGWTVVDPTAATEDDPTAGGTLNPSATQRVGGSLAVPAADRRIGLGVGVYYLHRTTELTEPEQALDLAVGLGARLGDQVTAALSLRDFIPHAAFDGAPIRVDGGLRWAPDTFAGVEVDVWTDLESMDTPQVGVATGGVVWLAQKVPVRLGYTHDPVEALDAVSAGIGAGTEGGTFDYQFRLPFGGIEENTGILGTWHGVSMLLRF